MYKTIVWPVEVQFGDCDPAGIVFFPNYLRWMDAASHHYFMRCGLPPWHAMPELAGCVGAPLLEIRTRFLSSVTHGQRLEVHTDIVAWTGKTFVQRHRLMRGDSLVCEGHETRTICVRDPYGKLKATLAPACVIAACTG